MNYEKIYTNLILKAKKREEVDPSWADSEYTERHHWYPKSLYPEYSKEDWNIVRLTAKEHYLSHYLLHKMLPSCSKMSYAFWRMSNTNNQGKRHIPNGRSFEVARKANAVAMSELHTGRTHSEEVKEKISRAMVGRVHSEETRAKMSKAHKGKVLTKPPRARPVNIYCHYTDKLLASNVLIGIWTKGTEYDKGNLCGTARSDRSKPSRLGNLHHHKGIYARYIDQGG